MPRVFPSHLERWRSVLGRTDPAATLQYLIDVAVAYCEERFPDETWDRLNVVHRVIKDGVFLPLSIPAFLISGMAQSLAERAMRYSRDVAWNTGAAEDGRAERELQGLAIAVDIGRLECPSALQWFEVEKKHFLAQLFEMVQPELRSRAHLDRLCAMALLDRASRLGAADALGWLHDLRCINSSQFRAAVRAKVHELRGLTIDALTELRVAAERTFGSGDLMEVRRLSRLVPALAAAAAECGLVEDDGLAEPRMSVVLIASGCDEISANRFANYCSTGNLIIDAREALARRSPVEGILRAIAAANEDAVAVPGSPTSRRQRIARILEGMGFAEASALLAKLRELQEQQFNDLLLQQVARKMTLAGDFQVGRFWAFASHVMNLADSRAFWDGSTAASEDSVARASCERAAIVREALKNASLSDRREFRGQLQPCIAWLASQRWSRDEPTSVMREIDAVLAELEVVQTSRKRALDQNLPGPSKRAHDRGL